MKYEKTEIGLSRFGKVWFNVDMEQEEQYNSSNAWPNQASGCKWVVTKADQENWPAINDIVLRPCTVIIKNPSPITIGNTEIGVQLELDGFAGPGWFFLQNLNWCNFLLLLTCSGIDGDNLLFC